MQQVPLETLFTVKPLFTVKACDVRCSYLESERETEQEEEVMDVSEESGESEAVEDESSEEEEDLKEVL